MTSKAYIKLFCPTHCISRVGPFLHSVSWEAPLYPPSETCARSGKWYSTPWLPEHLRKQQPDPWGGITEGRSPSSEAQAGGAHRRVWARVGYGRTEAWVSGHRRDGASNTVMVEVKVSPKV